MKKIILILLFSFLFAGYPASHAWIGAKVNQVISKNIEFMGINIEPIVRPLALIGSHVVNDRLIGETQIGDYGIDISLIRLFIMYWGTIEEGKNEFLYVVFWSVIVPDFLLKKETHPNLPTVFNLTRDQTELLEELVILDYIIKF